MNAIISWLKNFCNHVNIKRLKNGDQNSAAVPWESLPKDIMETIAQHFSSTDYLHSSLVCKSWQFVLQSDILRPQVPWLLIDLHQSGGHNLKFFNFLEAKYHNFMLPEGVDGGKIVGSSKGWLVIVVENTRWMFDIYLFNPISGVKYCLPTLPTNFYVRRIELSSSDVSKCTVAAIVNEFKLLALCKLGDESWEVLPYFSAVVEYGNLADLLFSDEELYILVDSPIGKGEIEDFNLTLPDSSESIPITLIHDFHYKRSAFFETIGMPPSIGSRIFLTHRRISYLVESIEGQVMLIHKHHSSCFIPQNDEVNEEDNDDDEIEEDDSDEDDDNDEDEEENGYKSSSLDGFRIYEIKELVDKTKLLCKQRGLGKAQALFLSYKSRMCLPVTSNLQGNCIYFVMDYANEIDYDYTYLVDINGMYNLDNFAIEPLIPKFDYLWDPEFIWFVPNL